jgi:hypothetical protein
VVWREGAESPHRLGKLALAAHAVATLGLVPGNGDVDKPLKEVFLGRIGRAPNVLEHLVCGEVLARADQLEPGGKAVRARS